MHAPAGFEPGHTHAQPFARDLRLDQLAILQLQLCVYIAAQMHQAAQHRWEAPLRWLLQQIEIMGTNVQR